LRLFLLGALVGFLVYAMAVAMQETRQGYEILKPQKRVYQI
jgi:hypothetical protein